MSPRASSSLRGPSSEIGTRHRPPSPVYASPLGTSHSARPTRTRPSTPRRSIDTSDSAGSPRTSPSAHPPPDTAHAERAEHSSSATTPRSGNATTAADLGWRAPTVRSRPGPATGSRGKAGRCGPPTTGRRSGPATSGSPVDGATTVRPCRPATRRGLLHYPCRKTLNGGIDRCRLGIGRRDARSQRTAPHPRAAARARQ